MEKEEEKEDGRGKGGGKRKGKKRRRKKEEDSISYILDFDLWKDFTSGSVLPLSAAT